MAITVHFIDNEWNMKICLLNLVRFSTPHKEEASLSVLYDTLKIWELEAEMNSIMNDNAADIVKGVNFCGDNFTEYLL